MAGQTITGKAFEYACLRAFEKHLSINKKAVSIESSSQYDTAKSAYEKLSENSQRNYNLAAETAVKLIFPLEPHIENGSGTIVLSLNADARGIEGDVRDLLCIRVAENWEIGISCKHQHEALKHPRITQSCDFGSNWMGYSCSDSFIQKINEIISPLDGTSMWREIPNKKKAYYMPILKAFCEEITTICSNCEDAPAKLLSYFFGTNDFYKIISRESRRQTKIMGFNMYGTMNKPVEKIKPIYRVARLHMPKRLVEARIKENSATTMILIFDGGWTVKMRLHNKDKVAKPTSLAWDVTLAGMPPEIYQQQRSWDE